MNRAAQWTAAFRAARSHARPPACSLRAAGAGLVLLTSLCAAAAQEAPGLAAPQDTALLVAQGDEPAVRLALEALPLRTNLPAPSATPVHQDGRSTNELAGTGYRIWLTRGRAAVGIGIGTPGELGPLGLRYRMSNGYSVFADAGLARAPGADADPAYDTTRVGVEWKPAKARFGLERGALGLRLDSGYRLTLRARRGGVGLYLRGQF